MRRSPIGDHWIEFYLQPRGSNGTPEAPWHLDGAEIAPLVAEAAATVGFGAGLTYWKHRPLVPRPARAASASSVRRLVWGDFHQSAAALRCATVSASHKRTNRRSHAEIRHRSGRLAILEPPAAGGSELRLSALLLVRRSPVAVRVEVFLANWSQTRSELRLELRNEYRSRHLPRHYFDAAHEVMGALRGDIERRTPESRPH